MVAETNAKEARLGSIETFLVSIKSKKFNEDRKFFLSTSYHAMTEAHPLQLFFIFLYTVKDVVKNRKEQLEEMAKHN